MSTINIHEAKTHLSRLIERVGQGEEIVIAKSGKPVARLVPYERPHVQRQPGSMRGKIQVAEDFDAPLPPEVLAGFQGRSVNLLLDTNALLWWLADSPRLGQRAREIMANPENLIYVSAASVWEIAIKVALGRLAAPPNIAQWLPEALVVNQFTELPISMAHAAGVETLPPHHADPFDRLLIAQALAEGFQIITGDETFAQYDVPLVRT